MSKARTYRITIGEHNIMILSNFSLFLQNRPMKHLLLLIIVCMLASLSKSADASFVLKKLSKTGKSAAFYAETQDNFPGFEKGDEVQVTLNNTPVVCKVRAINPTQRFVILERNDGQFTEGDKFSQITLVKSVTNLGFPNEAKKDIAQPSQPSAPPGEIISDRYDQFWNRKGRIYFGSVYDHVGGEKAAYQTKSKTAEYSYNALTMVYGFDWALARGFILGMESAWVWNAHSETTYTASQSKSDDRSHGFMDINGKARIHLLRAPEFPAELIFLAEFSPKIYETQQTRGGHQGTLGIATGMPMKAFYPFGEYRFTRLFKTTRKSTYSMPDLESDPNNTHTIRIGSEYKYSSGIFSGNFLFMMNDEFNVKSGTLAIDYGKHTDMGIEGAVSYATSWASLILDTQIVRRGDSDVTIRVYHTADRQNLLTTIRSDSYAGFMSWNLQGKIRWEF